MFTKITSSKVLLATLFSVVLLSPSVAAKAKQVDGPYYACCTYNHNSATDYFDYVLNLPKFGNSDAEDANCEANAAGQCGQVAYREINSQCNGVLESAGEWLDFFGYPSYMAEHDTKVTFSIKKSDQKSTVNNVQMTSCIAAALNKAAEEDGQILNPGFNCVKQDTTQPNTISWCQDVVGTVSLFLPWLVNLWSGFRRLFGTDILYSHHEWGRIHSSEERAGSLEMYDRGPRWFWFQF
jgi:hypothetical protein